MVFLLPTYFCAASLPQLTYGPGALERVSVSDRQALDSSLVNFLHAINTNSFETCFSVDFEYLRTQVNPFPFLMDAQKSGKFDDPWFFKPHVTFVAYESDDSYVVKIAFIGTEPGSNSPVLRMIHSLVARKKGDVFQFYSPLELIRAEWHTRKIGDVTYYYHDAFDEVTAKDFAQFNVQLAQKFDTEVMEVTYFKCRDGRELFYVIGCDYINNAYFAKTGGMAEPWRNYLFAGNDSESYPHELVHLYTAKKFGPSRNYIADEGYCTYIGGSGGLDLPELVTMVKVYLHDNPQSDILTLFKNNHQLHGEHSMLYTLSGLLMQMIERNHGVEGVQKIMTANGGASGFFEVLDKLLGINEQNFAERITSVLGD